MLIFTIIVIIKSNVDVCIEYWLFCTKYFACSISYNHFNMLKQFRELVWGQWEGLSMFCCVPSATLWDVTLQISSDRVSSIHFGLKPDM